jgi:hypothetical protein
MALSSPDPVVVRIAHPYDDWLPNGGGDFETEGYCFPESPADVRGEVRFNIGQDCATV